MQLELVKNTITKEHYDYGLRTNGGQHGVVLTKPEVVSLMLDLIGYKSSTGVVNKKILEPSCGEGVFLLEIVKRLITAVDWENTSIEQLKDCIRAYDVELVSVQITRSKVFNLLVDFNLEKNDANQLVNTWINQADYLLLESNEKFDFIIGNPPYIRIEKIHPMLTYEYCKRFKTLNDRADIYVAFIEKSLMLLNPTGKLSFICSNRWTQNKYGAPLREVISSRYQVNLFIDLHNASPFEEEVAAYPCIFVIGGNKTNDETNFIKIEDSNFSYDSILKHLDNKTLISKQFSISTVYPWFKGDEPWVLTKPGQFKILKKLESEFSCIEDSGKTKVRIGVATGSDEIFIINESDKELVEESRLVPLVMRENLIDGEVKNSHNYVINTHDQEGLINLDKYPKLQKYFSQHKATLSQRHIAKKSQSQWFKTIDRIQTALIQKQKLLIPDIAGSNTIILESGKFYPHHNLYFIISDEWDMETLGALLSSKIALFFIWAYAPRMRGDYLRFQAQYLRKICIPAQNTLSADLQKQLKNAFKERNFKKIDHLACEAYNLDSLPEFDFIDSRK